MARKKIIGSTAWPGSQMEKAPGQGFVCGSACPGTAGAAGSRMGKGRDGRFSCAPHLSPVTCPCLPSQAQHPSSRGGEHLSRSCQAEFLPFLGVSAAGNYAKILAAGSGACSIPWHLHLLPPSHPWGWAQCRDAAPWQLPLHGKHSCHLIINTN